jgi:hypothetical protein
MAQARHWLERLSQLTQFENVVLRQRDGRANGQTNQPAAASGRTSDRS